ncbi:hypothetical protein [Kitasatospora sp. NPDC005856]|uniref:hypothetical protein n=1 Tax=Kitasatospora sp. NPDC005856 TaxID=3154566 RepID=UPI0033CA17A4
MGNFSKGNLLDFSVTVNEKPAYLLPRTEHAKIYAKFLKVQASEASLSLDSDLKQFLEWIFAFTNADWQRVWGDARRSRYSSAEERDEMVLRYLLEQGIKRYTPGVPSSDDVRDWSVRIAPIRDIVSYSVGANIDSASQNPLLALPKVPFASGVDEGDIADLLDRLVKLVKDADQLSLSKTPAGEAAKRLVAAYAGYGSYWDALVECDAPLDEPFMIKTQEKRGLHLAEPGETVQNGLVRGSNWAWRKASSQLVVVGDAKSNHVNVRVADPNVELYAKGVRILNERYEKHDRGPDFQTATPELLSFYYSAQREGGRPHRVWLNLPLRTSLSGSTSRWVILLMTSTALVAFASFLFHWFNAGVNRTIGAGDVAVILVPSAIAASLLLVRESSTLNAEITKRWTVVTGFILLALWVFTMLMYGANKVDWGGGNKMRSSMPLVELVAVERVVR